MWPIGKGCLQPTESALWSGSIPGYVDGIKRMFVFATNPEQMRINDYMGIHVICCCAITRRNDWTEHVDSQRHHQLCG